MCRAINAWHFARLNLTYPPGRTEIDFPPTADKLMHSVYRIRVGRGAKEMMEYKDERNYLSLRERCQVVGIATGFLLALGFLAWLAITYAAPATIIDGITEYFRTGKMRRALGLCVGLVFYVAGLPVGLTLSLLVLFQGASGKRTRLTRWILHDMSQEAVRKRHERTLKSIEAEGELSSTEKALQSYLPPVAGWAIFLGFLLVAVAVLVWAAIPE